MRASGSMIYVTVKPLKSFPMEIAITENISKESLMEKGSIDGITVRFTMASGIKVLNMVMGFGMGWREIRTSASGSSLKRMGTEFTLGRMEIVLKASGIWVWKKGTVQIFSQMATHTQENTKMENHMAKVLRQQQMAVFTKGIS
jgi:hypothetical protein